VLAFRLSNTLTADLCVEVLKEALANFGRPEIFNADQGAQYTRQVWIQVLNAAAVAINMDGKGRWIDNVFINDEDQSGRDHHHQRRRQIHLSGTEIC
jgi:putative transposase